ncbi:glycosyltransferase family 4 protein [Variovorax sp. OV329]|uniref:glycosyltransferase family 4 protein n=1 Tax=Variovorax sp. OV329 TaxID=1882825 RepID=UPI0008F09CC0|nr:glycosyltransferase family 4 protein [Variovorax sp. OV329]SFN03708.1 Glycosyltransferase involved in cell wall bisynthesis [Variovorax sp. OV329]
MAGSARHCSFLYPGELATRTGGYTYDRRIINGLQALGWRVDLHSLGDGFPAPDAAALARARDVVASLPDGALAVADGLGFAVLGDLAHAHAKRLRWVALVHHPLALESGLDDSRRKALHTSERHALKAARHVIVTSPFTARNLVADFGVPASQISVVEPGTDPAPVSAGSPSGEGLNLLCVATITLRKGHALLVEALAALKERRWTLHCAGSLAMDPACSEALRQAIAREGLADRIVLHGEQDEAGLQRLYAAADAFVLPSYHEGYGMALAEAIARGLPVISTRAGAIADTVPEAAGLLVPPGDAAALRAGLQRLMDDGAWRGQLRAGALAARDALPDWETATARFAGALLAVVNEEG